MVILIPKLVLITIHTKSAEKKKVLWAAIPSVLKISFMLSLGILKTEFFKKNA